MSDKSKLLKKKKIIKEKLHFSYLMLRVIDRRIVFVHMRRLFFNENILKMLKKVVRKKVFTYCKHKWV